MSKDISVNLFFKRTNLFLDNDQDNNNDFLLKLSNKIDELLSQNKSEERPFSVKFLKSSSIKKEEIVLIKETIEFLNHKFRQYNASIPIGLSFYYLDSKSLLMLSKELKGIHLNSVDLKKSQLNLNVLEWFLNELYIDYIDIHDSIISCKEFYSPELNKNLSINNFLSSTFSTPYNHISLDSCEIQLYNESSLTFNLNGNKLRLQSCKFTLVKSISADHWIDYIELKFINKKKIDGFTPIEEERDLISLFDVECFYGGTNIPLELKFITKINTVIVEEVFLNSINFIEQTTEWVRLEYSLVKQHLTLGNKNIPIIKTKRIDIINVVYDTDDTVEDNETFVDDLFLAYQFKTRQLTIHSCFLKELPLLHKNNCEINTLIINNSIVNKIDLVDELKPYYHRLEDFVLERNIDNNLSSLKSLFFNENLNLIIRTQNQMPLESHQIREWLKEGIQYSEKVFDIVLSPRINWTLEDLLKIEYRKAWESLTSTLVRSFYITTVVGYSTESLLEICIRKQAFKLIDSSSSNIQTEIFDNVLEEGYYYLGLSNLLIANILLLSCPSTNSFHLVPVPDFVNTNNAFEEALTWANRNIEKSKFISES